MATNMRYDYKGTNKRGRPVLGVHKGDPADLVEPAFQAGWQALEVFDQAGVQVGGIGLDERGNRTYWSGF